MKRKALQATAESIDGWGTYHRCKCCKPGAQGDFYRHGVELMGMRLYTCGIDNCTYISSEPLRCADTCAAVTSASS